MDTTVVLAILGGIGAGLILVWKYFTSQDAKKTEIILKQVEQAQALATEERKRADLIQSQFLGSLDKITSSLDKITRSNNIALDKRDRLMEEHLKALQDLSDYLQHPVDRATKERSE